MDQIALQDRFEYEYRPPRRTEYEYEKKHKQCIASDFFVLVLVLSETVLVLDGCSKLRRSQS